MVTIILKGTMRLFWYIIIMIMRILVAMLFMCESQKCLCIINNNKKISRHILLQYFLFFPLIFLFVLRHVKYHTFLIFVFIDNSFNFHQSVFFDISKLIYLGVDMTKHLLWNIGWCNRRK